jgi:hypothetical protein
MDSNCSLYDPIAALFENDDEFPGSMKAGNFLNR